MPSPRKQKPAPGRQKKRKSKQAGYPSFLTKYLHIIAAVLVISGVAGIGYYFQFVHAAPDFIFVDECGRWHDPGTIWSDCDVSRDYPAGQTISVPVYGNTLIADYFGLPTRPNQLHAQVTLYHYDSPLTYAGYTCGAGNSCSSGISDSGYTGPASGDDGTICVQINSASIGQKKYPLFTVRYPKHAGTRDGYLDGAYDIDGHVYWRPGNCNAAGDGTGCSYIGIGPGLCHSAFVLAAYGTLSGGGGGNPTDPGNPSDPGNPADDPNPGGGDGGDGGGGGGSTKDGKKATQQSRSSASSGGASATKQSSKQNSVPQSASQGTGSTQPSLTPSPFYDGKYYQIGSLADTQKQASFLVRNSGITKLWFVLPCLLVLSGVGLAVWRLKRHS